MSDLSKQVSGSADHYESLDWNTRSDSIKCIVECG